MAQGNHLLRIGCIFIATRLVVCYDCVRGCDCSEDGRLQCDFPDVSIFPSGFPPNTTILDLSGNNIVQMPAESLAGLDNLEELNVANNNIYAIDQEAFKNGITMEKLRAQGNRISFLPPNVFLNLVNLRQVNLSKNALETFPNLSKNVNLEILSLSNNKITEIPKSALKNNIYLREIYLKSMGLRAAIRGVFPNDVSDITVTDFSDNRLWTTPSVIREMKGLKKLCLSSNPIKTFEAKDFRPLGVLNTLEMANVGMKEFPGSIFWLPMLEHLDISRNEISGSSLKNIQFSTLLSLKLTTDDAFDGIKILQTLDASDCEISVIHDRTFAVLLNLKKLNLSNNKLNALPKLKENRLLEELILDNNYIEVLSLDNFKNMEHLKLLSLANNSLTTVSSSLLHDELRITNLILSGNKFLSFPDAIAPNNLPRLESLDLSSNLLSGGLSLSSIAGLEYLHTLNLRGNTISEIIPDTAGFLWNLECLYISKNNLTLVENAAIDRYPSLVEFAADGNFIETVLDNTFFFNPLLEKLSLNDNGLYNFGYETLSPLIELKELMLLHNNIERCPNLSENLNLKILGLCNNPINDLKPGVFHGPQALESLLLRGTGITSLDADVFQDVSKIKILDIAQNKFSSVPSMVRNMPSLETLKLSGNPISNISAESLDGLWNLREAHFDNMKLSSLDVTDFLVTLPGLRFLWLSENPWRCDCEMESFTLEGSRSRANVVDRSKMICHAPGNFQGLNLDNLDFNDFTHCKASKVVRIQETSVLIRLPAFPDYIKKAVSYMSIPGDEKFIDVEKGKRDVTLHRLMQDTKYLVCVSTQYENAMTNGQESCIKFKTLTRNQQRPWSRGGFGGSLESSQLLLLVYLVLGAIVCLSVAITSLVSVFWYKRRKTMNRRDVQVGAESIESDDLDEHHNVSDFVDENAVETVTTVTERKSTPKRPNNDVRKGRVIEMTNVVGSDNLSFEDHTTPQRTKL